MLYTLPIIGEMPDDAAREEKRRGDGENAKERMSFCFCKLYSIHIHSSLPKAFSFRFFVNHLYVPLIVSASLTLLPKIIPSSTFCVQKSHHQPLLLFDSRCFEKCNSVLKGLRQVLQNRISI